MYVRNVVRLLLSLIMLDCVASYSHFREQIPNGEMVPHPCNPNYIWEGVGHVARRGGGERNPFGLDFYRNGMVWNKTICRKDSDGDGKTNGEELGDPDCIWTPNEDPTRKVGLSHPGICDPLDSSVCGDRSSFVNCTQMDFQCDAIKAKDVFYFTIRLPTTPVPAEVTTYTCMTFDFPTDGDYHAIAFTPHVDNMDVLHHILLYGCPDADAVTHEKDKPYGCFMNVGDGCNTLLSAWGLGSDGICLPPNAGLRIGAGIKVGLIQVHWNNPILAENTTDSSGINIYLTSKLRPFDAGMLMYGQTLLQIPPGENHFSVEGKCGSVCSHLIMNGSVNIFGATNHMHYLGTGALSSLVKPKRVQNLAFDEKFSYDRPILHIFDKEAIMDPGDELKITCQFKTTSRTMTTHFGLGTDDEMCLGFIFYYPQDSFLATDCTSYGDIGSCEWDQPLIQGCDLKTFSNFSHPEISDRYMTVKKNCQVGYCKKECKPIIKQLNQHKCLSGTMRTVFMRRLSRSIMGAEFWSLLTSCDVQIALEEKCAKPTDVTLSAAASTVTVAMSLVIVFSMITVI